MNRSPFSSYLFNPPSQVPNHNMTLTVKAAWVASSTIHFEVTRGSYGLAPGTEGWTNMMRKGDRFISYTTEKDNPLSLSNPHVYSIKEYSRTHQLVVRVIEGWIFLKDEQVGQFERHVDEHHESNNYLRTIYEDSRGNLWLGSIAELYLYSPENRKRTLIN